MPLPFAVDSIDAIPETQRDLYKESNGKFVLDVDGYEDPTNLKSALAKERKAAADAAKQVKSWQDLGKTPDEILALIDTASKAEAEKLTKGGEWDKLKEQITSQHKGELGKKDVEITTLRKRLESEMVDKTATSAIANAKGSTALLLPHVRASVRVIEEGGDFSVRVVDVAGNPRVNSKGEFLSIADLVDEMRQSEVFGRAFEPSGTTGGGSHQSSGGGGGKKTMKQEAIDAMRPKDKAAFFASGGIAV